MINPFVGPNPLTEKNALHGRRREVRELLYLLTSERIVLLHSPSGAGKSSLINGGGGLIEKLTKHFTVWRPTRMNLQPGAASLGNRYVASAIAGFMEDGDGKKGTPVSVKASSLEEYVLGRRAAEGVEGGLVLIFDQFEEVLRVDPHDVVQKQEFFRQTGDLLRDPLIWALFVIREDYLAAFEPYSRLIPTHFSNRYRLDLFKRETAQQVFEGLVADGGRSADPKATARLLDDLSTLKVQLADGTTEERKGEAIHIEPMQLQVVCETLWNQLKGSVITEEDITKFGDVTKALSTYYTLAIERIGGDDRGLRWAMRDWFGEKLITPEGIRGQVQERPNASGGLDNKIIAKLEDAHLIRKEIRGRSVWYELSHDRLIQPVLESNAWRFSTFDFGAYYDQQVTAIAGEDKLREQRFRNWVGRLITENGLRTELPAEDAEAASALANSYFLRTKSRDGQVFYRLTHDRLIEPVRKRNAEWLDQHLSWVEKRALVWLADERDSLLLVGKEYRTAQKWFRTNTHLLEDVTRFLKACRAANSWMLAKYAMVLLLLVLLGGAWYLVARVWQEQQKTHEANLEFGRAAFQAKANAEEARMQSDKARAKEQEARDNAEKARDNAKEARDNADRARANAEEARTNADKALLEKDKAVAAERAATESAKTAFARLLLAEQATLAVSGTNLPTKTLLTLAAERVRPSREGYYFLRSNMTFMPRTVTSYQRPEKFPFREIVFSPRGDRLAALSGDAKEGQLAQYRGDRLETVGAVKSTGGNPRIVRFSADGKFLAFLSDDSLHVVDANLEEVWSRPLVVHLAFHPTLPVIAITTKGSVQLLRVTDGAGAAKLAGNCEQAKMAVFSADGASMVSVCGSGLRRNIADVGAKESFAGAGTLREHPFPDTRNALKEEFLDVQANGNANFVAMTKSNVYSLVLNSEPIPNFFESKRPRSIHASSVAGVFGFILEDGTAYVRTSPSSTVRKVFMGVGGIVFGPGAIRRMAVSTSSDAFTVYQNGIDVSREVEVGLDGELKQVAFRFNKTQIASITDGVLVLSEYNPRPPYVALRAKDRVYGFSDGNSIAAVQQVDKWNVEHVRVLSMIDGRQLGQWSSISPIHAISVSYDGHWILAVCDQHIELAEVTDGKQRLHNHVQVKLSGLSLMKSKGMVAVSSDGKTVAYAAAEKGSPRIVLVNLESKKETAFPFLSPITAIAFNSSGTKIALGDDTAKIYTLDLNSRKVSEIVAKSTRELTGSGRPAEDIAFSNDDKYVIIHRRGGIRDQAASVEIVEPATGALQEDNDFRPSLKAVGFGEKDGYLYGFEVEHESVKLRRLRFQKADLMKDACERLKRNLTDAEWKKHAGNEPYIKSCPE